MRKPKKSASASKQKKQASSKMSDLPPRVDDRKVKGGMNKSELVQMLSNRGK